MKVDATLQAVGRQCGIDVNAIISKYKNDVEQHSSKPEEVQSFTNKFDGLQICEVCKGCGLRKELYNHQVKEVNCEKCEGEGIVPNEKMGVIRGVSGHCETADRGAVR